MVVKELLNKLNYRRKHDNFVLIKNDKRKSKPFAYTYGKDINNLKVADFKTEVLNTPYIECELIVLKTKIKHGKERTIRRLITIYWEE